MAGISPRVSEIPNDRTEKSVIRENIIFFLWIKESFGYFNKFSGVLEKKETNFQSTAQNAASLLSLLVEGNIKWITSIITYLLFIGPTE